MRMMQNCRRLAVVLVGITALVIGGMLLAVTPVRATEACNNCGSTICSSQGFQITLTAFSVNSLAGTSSWTYEVCNQAGPPRVQPCTPEKDLSHIDINLPGFNECLTETQSVSLAQTGGNDKATLVCVVEPRDPSCDIDNTDNGLVAKCDVKNESDENLNNLDLGECVEMTLTITGEVPTVGKGAIEVVTKAGRTCEADAICGPACPCEEELDGCLTRTIGFWGTHPNITDQFNNNGLTVCGKPIGDAAKLATDVLCQVPGKGGKGNQAQIQLERQLAAAQLNLAATAANGGSCGSDITARIAECEALCGKNQATISSSGCIEDLNEFNNSQDTVAVTPSPFDHPGPADPSLCQAAKTGQVN
jgi:hypothetical protein